MAGIDRNGKGGDMGQNGLSRALTAAAVGIGAAIGAPCLVDAVSASVWGRIVVLSLLLVLCGLLCAAFILALVGQICAPRASHHEERLYLLADVFLIAAVGLLFATCVFAFVLTMVGLAAGIS